MSATVDIDLINRILAGDSAAFKNVIAAYQQLVFSVALKVLGNANDAEDATQETFIKAYKSLKNFRLESKFSTWLYRIAYNTCLDMNKLKHNQSTFNTLESHEWKLSTESEQKADLLYDFDQALGQLSLKHRQVIVLFYYNQFSYKEIADIIEDSEGNIKTMLYRARQQLKTIFEEKEA